MSKKELKDAIPLILKNVSFINYLIYNDYILNKDQSEPDHLVFDRFDTYSNHITETIILVKNNQQFKFKSLTKNDKGDIIDFVSNRIQDKHSGNKEINLIEACKRLLIFQSLDFNSPEGGIDIDSKSIKEFQEFFHNIYSEIFDLEASTSSEYLQSIGIGEETFKNEAFINTIYSNKFPFEKNTDKKFSDTSFILKNSNENEVGLVYYNFLEDISSTKKDVFYYAPFSNTKNAIWMSNTAFNKVCLVSDPREAFCFQQLNPEQKYTYIAPAPGLKSLSSYQIESIFNFVDQTNRYITLASNDSIMGNIMDLHFIARYTYESSNLIVIDTHGNHIEVMYKAKDKSEQTVLYDLVTQIQKRNSYIKKQITDYTEGNVNPYLESELFKIDMDRTKNYLIKIIVPRRNNQIHWFNRTLVKVKGFERINFNKPPQDSWYFSLLKSNDLIERTDSIFESSKISSIS